MQRNYLSLLLLAFLSGGCVSFESVTTVAKVGTTLVDYKTVNENVNFLCAEMKAMPGLGQLRCDSLEVRSKRVDKGVDILVGYSNVLLLATEDSDFSLSDIVAQTAQAGQAARWITASEAQLAGAQSIATGLQTFITGGLKRRAIGQTVKAQGAAVDQVCAGLLNLISLQKQEFRNYEVGAQQRALENAGFQLELARKNGVNTQPANLDKDVLLLARLYVRDETRKLSQIEKAVQAFRAGHQTLVREAAKVGRKKDAEVVRQIVESLKGIYEGIDQFTTPVTENE